MARKPKQVEINSTADFVQMIEDRYGEYIVTKNEEVANRKLSIIPTGSISLDISTGINGIPRGRFTEIYGPGSSAKTSLCLSIAKEAIKLGLRVLYVEPENSLDTQYIRSLVGMVGNENFVLAQPETAEQAFYICEAGIKSHEFQLVILDSIGALVTEDEKEDDPDKSHVAIVTRKLGSFLKRIAFEIRKEDVAFVSVNQIRDAIGNPYAGMSTPGGHILKHLLALRIQLSKSEDIVRVEDGKETKVGIYSRYVIKKNKLAPPFRTFNFPLIFGKGIDQVLDLVNFAEMLGILTKRGSYYVFQEELLGRGLANTCDMLREEKNKQTLDKIRDMCYNVGIVTDKTIEREEEFEQKPESEENI